MWGPLRKQRGLRLPSNADRMRTMARQRLLSVGDPGLPLAVAPAVPPILAGPALQPPFSQAPASHGHGHAPSLPHFAHAHLAYSTALPIMAAGHLGPASLAATPPALHHPHLAAPATMGFAHPLLLPAAYTHAAYPVYSSASHSRATVSSALPHHVGAAHDSVDTSVPLMPPSRPLSLASGPSYAARPTPPPHQGFQGPPPGFTSVAPSSVMSGSALPPAAGGAADSAVGLHIPSGLSVGRLSVLTGADIPHPAPSDGGRPPLRRPGSLADSASSALGLLLGLDTPRADDGLAGTNPLTVSDGDDDDDDGGLPAGSSARTHAQAAVAAGEIAVPSASQEAAGRAAKRGRDEDDDEDDDDEGGHASDREGTAAGGGAQRAAGGADAVRGAEADGSGPPPAQRPRALDCPILGPERPPSLVSPPPGDDLKSAAQGCSSASSVVATTRWRLPVVAPPLGDAARDHAASRPASLAAAAPAGDDPIPSSASAVARPSSAAGPPHLPRSLCPSDASALLERVELQDAVLVRQSKHIAALYSDVRRMTAALEALTRRLGPP